MTTLEFISSLVSSLAWPLTAIALALLLRTPLHHLLSGRVRRWRAGPSGVEVEYWEEVAKETRAALPESAAGRQPTLPEEVGALSLREELQGLAEDDPAGAILEAFSRVERALRERVEPQAPEAIHASSAVGVAAIAAAHGVIDKSLASTIEGLGILRNLAVHRTSARELSPGKALEFLDLADAALYSIRRSAPAE